MATSGSNNNTHGNGEPDVRSIKRSIAYRAKYRKGQGETPLYKVFPPGLVVPHPKNRGGDPCVSQRTRELGNTVMGDGCDPLDAKSSAVAVEEFPASEQKKPDWASLQNHFQSQVKGKDPHMACCQDGMSALIGSLSHSHWNCLSRNIGAGMYGCECKSRGDGGGGCNCKVASFLDAKGHYSLDLLKTIDAAWAELVEVGQPWELLDHRMDIEEPEAALVISIALNKKNEAAMRTGHTQIMRTLVGLCKPDPSKADASVQFEPVRSKMVDYYGCAVDHPDFLQAFRLIMDCGGFGSPHLENLEDFTGVYVNPTFRNLRWETYSAVAVLPYNRPRVKMAFIKYTWRQKPTRGWCPVCPNIAFRFEPKGKFAMTQSIEDIEETIGVFHRRVLAVAGGKMSKNEVIRLTAEVDIMLVSHLINLPKQPPGNQTLKEQEEELQKACAVDLVLKIVKACDKYKISLVDLGANLDTNRSQNKILTTCSRIATDPQELEDTKKKAAADDAAKEAKKKASAVAELAPQAAVLTKDGDVVAAPITRPAFVEKKVEEIPWTGWVEGVETEVDTGFLKSLLKTAFFRFSDQFPLDDLQMALVRKGSDLMTKAKKKIPKGALRVPLHYRKESSLIVMGKDSGKVSERAVSACIWLPTNAHERLCGVETGETEYVISCNPELKVPAPVVTGEDRKWQLSDAVHPFWTIKRQDKKDEETNCQIAYQTTVIVIATTPEEQMKHKSHPETITVRVSIPFIVNTKEIKADERIVLTWAVKPKPEKTIEKRTKTWVEDLLAHEKKRMRLDKPKGADTREDE